MRHPILLAAALAVLSTPCLAITSAPVTLVTLYPGDLIVIESSPVATSEEIKVQATFAPTPAVDAWEQRRGVVAWKMKMAPGETSKFNVEYRIDYPKEGQLLGLR